MKHRVYQFNDNTLLTVSAYDKNSDIMRTLRFYKSIKYNNWAIRLNPHEATTKIPEILSKVENEHNKYMKNYKKLPQESEVKRTLINVFNNANIPNDICVKITKSISYECKCMNNVVCLACTHACCAKAKRRFCMCTMAFSCEDHGYTCFGSHD